MIQNSIFSKNILLWHKNTNIKKLPWQSEKTIYKIWISEIMLQQTQVQTVIPYYENFIKKFPTIFILAQAELNEVLHIWSGLGYYKRAINIHQSAQIIINNYNGKFPKNFNILISLPGIGRSTAGAILSLALNQRYAILDGNIKRILIRYYNLNFQTQKKTETNNKLWTLIDTLMPLKGQDIACFNQAMMNLGRLICTPNHPKCTICPINNNCQSFSKKDLDLNIKKTNFKKKIKISHNIQWIILFNKKDDTIYLKQRSKEKIWNKLFCFPEFHDINSLNLWLLKYNIYNKIRENMNILTCSISNVNLKIYPILININTNDVTLLNIKKNKIWYNLYKPPVIGLPAPVFKILKNLKY